MSKSAGVLRVRQVKSGIGYDRKQRATLKALGLGKMGRVRELPDNPQVRGMVAAITHLVVVEGKTDGGEAVERRERGGSNEAART
jgi:large subunit ribosomal protein L30